MKCNIGEVIDVTLDIVLWSTVLLDKAFLLQPSQIQRHSARFKVKGTLVHGPMCHLSWSGIWQVLSGFAALARIKGKEESQSDPQTAAFWRTTCC